jgi:septum formation protein
MARATLKPLGLSITVWKNRAIMLILASQSQSRRALLAGAGLEFQVEPAAVDERKLERDARHAPAELARRLAMAKAENVAARHSGAYVIGADQVLSLNGEVLHKPATLDQARERLDALRGKTHTLHSGIALARNATTIWAGVESAELTMRNFTDAERETVLALEGTQALTSVGAYRLEGPAVRLFETVRGDYFTILGLPLLPLLAALREHAPAEFGETE